MLRGVARLRSGKEPTVTIEAKAWLTSLACGKAKELGYPRELWNDAASCPARTRAWPAEEYCLANLAQSALEEGCIEEQAEQPERCGGHHSYDENLGCPGDRDDVPRATCPRAACSRELARDHERPGADASSVRRSFRSDAERVCNLHSLVGRQPYGRGIQPSREILRRRDRPK
jgi:hypothetical protein